MRTIIENRLETRADKPNGREVFVKQILYRKPHKKICRANRKDKRGSGCEKARKAASCRRDRATSAERFWTKKAAPTMWAAVVTNGGHCEYGEKQRNLTAWGLPRTFVSKLLWVSRRPSSLDECRRVCGARWTAPWLRTKGIRWESGSCKIKRFRWLANEEAKSNLVRIYWEDNERERAK